MTYTMLTGVMLLLVAAAIANIRGLKVLHELLHFLVVGLSTGMLVFTIAITKNFLETALFVGVLALASYLWYDANKYDKATSDKEMPEVGELFTESWSSKEVIVTGADQVHVTTMTTEEGNHKVYPLGTFWELHARP